jgi:hypothetical protein
MIRVGSRKARAEACRCRVPIANKNHYSWARGLYGGKEDPSSLVAFPALPDYVPTTYYVDYYARLFLTYLITDVISEV